MTTIQTLYEGASFKPTFDSLGLAWMPTANWSEVAGLNAPLAWGPNSHPVLLARSIATYLRSLPDGVPWVIDMGGWSILPLILPARGAIISDVCRGLDSGNLACEDMVTRQATFFKALRAQGIKPEEVMFYFDDGNEYSLYAETLIGIPDPFKPIRDVYLGGKTLAPTEVDRRFHQMMVNAHKTMQESHDYDPERIIVAGCCAVDTQAEGPAINTPISHIWAGDYPGATPAMWDAAWAQHGDTIARITALGRKSWLHLSATMPPAQAARGSRLGATFNAVFCGGSATAPIIQAAAQAIGTTIATGV